MALTALFQFPLFAAEPLQNLGDRFIFAMMWCPAIAAVVVSVLAHRPLGAMGWRMPRARYLLIAFLIPAAYTAIAYSLAWNVGGFAIFNAEQSFDAGDLAVSWLIGCTFALGEEIGWRGFLTPLLARSMSFGRVALLNGFIWTAWHLPSIVRGDYGSGAPLGFEVLCFTLMIVGMSFAITWLRLSSGSIWPAVVMHGTHNVLLQNLWGPFTTETSWTSRIVGEFGLGLALTALLAGLAVFALYRHQAKRRRGDEFPAGVLPFGATLIEH